MGRSDRVDIRSFEESDWAAVWGLLDPVFRAGETYAFPLDISEADARCGWTGGGKAVFVAVDPEEGAVLGTYYLKCNQEGPGAHVCNCGYVVSASARGRGVATRMCEHSQTEAVERGYRAMQFNLVAVSNEGAVRLWKKLGFEVVGTLPGAFRHPSRGFIDAHVMYKTLVR